MIRTWLVPLCLLVLTAGAQAAGASQASATPEGGPLSDVAQIDAGDGFTCARLTTGQARCWGSNFSGQLGTGNDDDSNVPATVFRPDGIAPLTGVAQIEAGSESSCARLTNGEVRCWGSNFNGGLGDGSNDDSLLPVPVILPNGSRLDDVVQIGVTDYFACARLADRRVRCWGRNDYGQIGDGTTTERLRARLVTIPGGSALTGVTQIAVGRDHACALVQGGNVRCWGENGEGSLGDGTTQERHRARFVKNRAGTGLLSSVAEVFSGDSFSCARLVNGQARCWGENLYGEMGDGTFDVNRLLPVIVKAPSGTGRLTGVLRLGGSSSGSHVCARVTGPQLRCWGRNGDGQIGDGTTDTDRLLPVTVLDPTGTIPLSSVAQVSPGTVHTCARLTTGQARCWGKGNDGELGNGADDNHSLPVVVLT